MGSRPSHAVHSIGRSAGMASRTASACRPKAPLTVVGSSGWSLDRVRSIVRTVSNHGRISGGASSNTLQTVLDPLVCQHSGLRTGAADR